EIGVSGKVVAIDEGPGDDATAARPLHERQEVRPTEHQEKPIRGHRCRRTEDHEEDPSSTLRIPRQDEGDHERPDIAREPHQGVAGEIDIERDRPDPPPLQGH
ncbi:hypothetical protein RZS08_54000, partial [Arthrospira platensis SPKY1]|nr:hypothetical protein [Arthrospira platensis SPKY1]